MQRLITALSNDPDLANVEMATLPKVLQTPFVVIGHEYISFFSGMGESNILMVLLSTCRIYYRRITVYTGSDSLLDYDINKQGFLRFSGTVCFKKHVTASESNSPDSHFKNFITTAATQTLVVRHLPKHFGQDYV